ncbi:MAG: sigma-54-dependent Fis family transcriptional regulator [Nitrospirae bacterium]|nr:sigma-54-dependent Fis family transcriptional regulator [Nitrospirota bacterium]
MFLRYAGMGRVLSICDGRKVLPLLGEQDAAVVVLDLIMPHLPGKELLAGIRSEFPHIPVIVMTAVNELDVAVECMKAGAFDYLVKPVDRSRFVSSVEKALKFRELNDEVSYLKHHMLADGIEREDAFSSIITNSPKMLAIFRYAEAVAKTQRPVCIVGETGVGKELLAEAIFILSDLKGEFVPVNVAGLDDAIFPDTLFGHKKGAFTGAESERAGLIERASGGVLLLDEIGDLSETSQVKLLRLLEEHKYYPIGSDVPKKSDARIITSTNKDLEEAMARGTFRKDLYYRLCGHSIHVPPLRERTEDIPLLLDHFLEQASASLSKEKPLHSDRTASMLSTYHFPGNVRELQAMVYDVMTRRRSGALTAGDFRDYLTQNKGVREDLFPDPPEEPVIWPRISGKFPTLKELEDFAITEAMARAQGKQATAASLLGITRQALNRRLLRKSKRE